MPDNVLPRLFFSSAILNIVRPCSLRSTGTGIFDDGGINSRGGTTAGLFQRVLLVD